MDQLHLSQSANRYASQQANIRIKSSTGGVFEEAIAIASLLLDANCSVAATVRTAGGFIDNSFQVQSLKTLFFIF
jgi:hypothetical protein